MNRRDFLKTTASVAAMTAVPAPILAPVAIAEAAPVVTPMWVIGTAGEFDWRGIAADTLEEAKRIFAADYLGADETSPELQEIADSLDGRRCESWDKLDREPNGADWFKEGFGASCDRCGYETDSCDGHAVKDEAICGDCMTLADWDIIDPEHAAELREELADERAA